MRTKNRLGQQVWNVGGESRGCRSRMVVLDPNDIDSHLSEEAKDKSYITNVREFRVWSLDVASSASDEWLDDVGWQASCYIRLLRTGVGTCCHVTHLLWFCLQYKPALPDHTALPDDLWYLAESRVATLEMMGRWTKLGCQSWAKSTTTMKDVSSGQRK